MIFFFFGKVCLQSFTPVRRCGILPLEGSPFCVCIQKLAQEHFPSEWDWNNWYAILISALLLCFGSGCIWWKVSPCGVAACNSSGLCGTSWLPNFEWKVIYTADTVGEKHSGVCKRSSLCHTEVIHPFWIVATGLWSFFSHWCVLLATYSFLLHSLPSLQEHNLSKCFFPFLSRLNVSSLTWCMCWQIF